MNHDGAVNAPSLEAPRNWEKWVWLALLLVVLVGHVVYAQRLRAGSDETQHLHVVWAWATGRLVYRDVFDNHTPLFHMLYAPLFRALGERPDILVPMRMAVIPLYLVTIGSLAYLGEGLFSRRVGIWAAFVVGLWPLFFLTSVEFRTDALWMTLWMLSLAVFLGRALTVRRAALGGLLMGATFATSMKTSVLALSFLGALALALLLDWAMRRSTEGGRELLRAVGAALAGLLVVPAGIVAYFASQRALPQFMYGVFWHNMVPGMGHRRPGDFLASPANCALVFGGVAAVCLLLAWLLLRGPVAGRERRLRRAVLLLTFGLYAAGMYCYWPLLTKQDQMPAIPLVGLFLVALFFAVADALAPRRRWALAALTGLLVLWLGYCGRDIVKERSLRKNNMVSTVERIRNVLALTEPGEMVMDGKGETIFRPRPYFYALENITSNRMKMGWLPDDVAEHLIATRTAVVHPFRLPDAAAAFVTKNYLPLAEADDLRVLGQLLTIAPESSAVEFQVSVPAVYCFLEDGEQLAGMLDGGHLTGAEEIAAGLHRFVPTRPVKKFALFLERARARGFHPDATNPKL